jgi:hypothetical protein
MLPSRFESENPIVITFRKRAVPLLLALLVLTCACAPGIALYSPPAYEQAVSAKVESLSLMDKAADSASVHRSEIDALVLRIEKAHEYAKGRPHNEISAKQWEILMDPKEGLLGEFLDRWSRAPIQSQSYLTAKKKQIAEAFDAIIGLESGKLKPSNLQSK